MRFASKGPYICFGGSGGLIGHFPTLTEAKRACGRDSGQPCGEWRKEDEGTYFAWGNGCTIVVGWDHPKAPAREDAEKALARYRFRESLR